MGLKVIPFEYCSLDRAARFFGCETEDFFHWYDMKKIAISLLLSDDHATLLSIDNTSVEYKTAFLGSDHIVYDVAASADNKFSYIDEFSAFIGHRLSFDSLCDVYRVNGFAHDFWKPCDEIIQSIRSGGLVRESFSASPYDYDGDFRVMVSVEEHHQHSDPDSPIVHFYPSFTLSDLMLHKIDLDKINHLIAGLPYAGVEDGEKNDQLSIPSKYMGNDTTVAKAKCKVTKKQSDVIVALLRHIGITDDEMKGSITNFRRRLARLAPKISLPDDDKSLIDWLKKGGIDR